MSSNSVCNHTRDKQIGLPLSGRPILLSLVCKAKFRRRTSHEPNRMQMRKILFSLSLAFDSAHVKYGV